MAGGLAHGDGLARRKLDRLEGGIVVAVVLAQFDHRADRRARRHQFIGFFAAVGDGDEDLSLVRLRRQAPDMANGDLAELEGMRQSASYGGGRQGQAKKDSAVHRITSSGWW